MIKHIKGAVFDLDGVITQTAKVHFKAWKKVFDDYLKTKEKKFREFTLKDDYIPYVDGKPRYEGVESFLTSRKIIIPFGNVDDDANKETICAIGNRKNKAFRDIVESEGVEIYENAVDFITRIKSYGIKTAVASSSKNCRFILEKTNLKDLFLTIVDGTDLKKQNLNGKPEPDMFIKAAENIGVTPNETIVFEDAVSGVEAGKKGNFCLVVGIARNDKDELLDSGADIAVSNFAELTEEKINKWLTEGIEKDSWNLTYYKFKEEKETLRECLTTTGNGYFGTRGCAEGSKASETHYPGTYIAGVYNTLPSEVHGKIIYNSDFVNCPDWTLIQIKINNGDFFRPLDNKIISYRHNFNIKYGILSRKIIFENKDGHITEIRTKRIASMADPHIGAMEYKVIPVNYSGKIYLKSSVDGSVINWGVKRYRDLSSKHLSFKEAFDKDGVMHLHTKTSSSNINLHFSSKSEFFIKEKTPQRETSFGEESITEILSFTAQEKSEYVFTKFVSIYTSNDKGVKNPKEESLNALKKNLDFNNVLNEHKKAWDKLWDKCDFLIGGDRFNQKAVRFHIYHLLASASPHNEKIDAGITARGLHGEAYRGHIFWDEIFIFPFYNLHFPKITKALLMYRYRRLDAARENAVKHGYKGAMYPWQTSDTGKEETQVIHYNPISGKWDPDLSQLQRHVSIAILYNIWNYYYCTNDLKWTEKYGIEMMLEITRFWASKAKFSKENGKYHIEKVMGPDEFHEKYPNNKDGGLKDNAYTNIMVCWLMHKTIETYEHMSENKKSSIREKINFKESEIKNWEKIVEKMNVVITDHLMHQFDGYMDLKEVDWDYYKNKYGDIHRMDRLIKAEGDSPDNYKVAKQADVLMMFYLLSPDQVANILNLMGLGEFDETNLIKENYEYYEPRTSHGSTLSHIVHSSVLKYIPGKTKEMYYKFLTALNSDLNDIQGGTTHEGIHTGVMGGTIDIVYKTFGGINIFKDHFKILPHLPWNWKKLSFKLVHRNVWYEFIISHNQIKVKTSDIKNSNYIEFKEKTYNFKTKEIVINY